MSQEERDLTRKRTTIVLTIAATAPAERTAPEKAPGYERELWKQGRSDPRRTGRRPR